MKLLFSMMVLMLLLQASVNGIQINHYNQNTLPEQDVQVGTSSDPNSSKPQDVQLEDQKGDAETILVIVGAIIGAIIGAIVGHGSVIVRRLINQIIRDEVDLRDGLDLRYRSVFIGLVVGLIIGGGLAHIGGGLAFIGSASTIIGAIIGGASTIIAAIIALFIGGKIIVGKTTISSKHPMRERFYDIMDDLLKDESSVDEWEGARYEKLKILSATEKYKFATYFLHKLLLELGFHARRTDLDASHRGVWDIIAENKNTTFSFEVKVASQGNNGLHQFNGIKLDTASNCIFLLGVLPDELRYKIITKKDFDKYTMTPMRKGANTDFKITFRSEELNSFEQFEREIYNLLGKPD